MIYIPDDSYECYIVYDSNTIRAFHDEFNNNTSVDYTDYFINSHYISNESSLIYNGENYNCIDSSLLTTNIYYRNDLPSILIIFGIITLFAFYMPFRIFKTLFRKGKN